MAAPSERPEYVDEAPAEVVAVDEAGLDGLGSGVVVERGRR